MVSVISKLNLNELGFKERRVGRVTILDADAQMRIKLRFGGSSVTLANAAASLVAAGQTHILLNLDGVSSLGAKSMGELVSALVAVKDSGGELKLFNLGPTVRQLMQATNLFAVFGLYESEAQAIDSFSVSATPKLEY
jgi:anti-sigma B factor antagonist